MKRLACLLALSLALPALAAAPKLTLTSAGTGKKALLRYHIKANTPAHFVMVMKMDMAMKMGGRDLPKMPMPAIAFTFDGKATSVAKNGDISYQLTLSDVGIRATKDTPDTLKAALKQGLAPLKGMVMSGVMTNRGFNLNGSIKAKGTIPPSMQPTLDQMRQSMEQMSQPLPLEPVGEGARWTVESALEQNGMKIHQTAHVALVSVIQSRITTKVRLEQRATAQTIALPGVPASMTVQLQQLQGTGSGSNTVNLNRLAPEKSDVTAQSHVAMNLAGKGQNVDMTMDMTITITTRGK